MLKIIAITLTGVMVLICMIAFYAFQTGIAVIHVNDKVHGKRVFLPVPVGLMNLGLSMVPGELLSQVKNDLGPHRNVVQSLADELENLPDTNFVDVQGKDQHVLVSKNGGNLIIDVVTPDETVYVSVPIRSTGNIVSKLASMNDRN